mgnify:FL=1
MLEFLFDMIFPHDACALCRMPGIFWSKKPWCRECDAKLRSGEETKVICDRCGKYLCDGGALCSGCREKEPPFYIARAVGPYESDHKVAVKILKFLCRRYVGIRMGEMMAQVVKNEPRYWPLDLVVPVPISAENMKRRGVNQSEVLAYYTSRDLKLKMASGVLARVKETPSQRELSKEEREQNLRAAFIVQQAHKVQGKNVLLVDDVYTTGSTVKECTLGLLEAGAKRVAVVTWATGRGF